MQQCAKQLLICNHVIYPFKENHFFFPFLLFWCLGDKQIKYRISASHCLLAVPYSRQKLESLSGLSIKGKCQAINFAYDRKLSLVIISVKCNRISLRLGSNYCYQYHFNLNSNAGAQLNLMLISFPILLNWRSVFLDPFDMCLVHTAKISRCLPHFVTKPQI